MTELSEARARAVEARDEARNHVEHFPISEGDAVRVTRLADVIDALLAASAPVEGDEREALAVCAWCPADARGSAWHNDGLLHPSCGQIDHGFGWVPDESASRRPSTPLPKAFSEEDAERASFASFVDHLGVEVNEEHEGEWWDGYRQAQRDHIRKARAALSAVHPEAVSEAQAAPVEGDEREALAVIVKQVSQKFGGPSLAEFANDPPIRKHYATADAVLAWLSTRRPSPPTEEQVEAAASAHATHVTGYSMRDGGYTYTCRCGWSETGDDAQSAAQKHRALKALEAAARVGGEG